MVYDAASERQSVRCELAWSNDTITWHRIEEGKDVVPLGPEGSFDSHICYGSIPLQEPSTGRVLEYYFGGDGPHFGVRNSSLALMTFRPAGLAGVGAPTDWITPVSGRTVPLDVTGPKLVVTVDSDIPDGERAGSVSKPPGSVVMHCAASSCGAAIECAPISGTNVTDQVLIGCDFGALVGRAIALDILVSGGALLYTLGFATAEAAQQLSKIHA